MRAFALGEAVIPFADAVFRFTHPCGHQAIAVATLPAIKRLIAIIGVVTRQILFQFDYGRGWVGSAFTRGPIKTQSLCGCRKSVFNNAIIGSDRQIKTVASITVFVVENIDVNNHYK